MGSKFAISCLLVAALFVFDVSGTYFGGGGGGGVGIGGGGIGGGYSHGWGHWICTCRRWCLPWEIVVARKCILPPLPSWKKTCCFKIRGYGGGYGGIGGGAGAGYFGGFGYGGADGYGYRSFPGKGSSSY